MTNNIIETPDGTVRCQHNPNKEGTSLERLPFRTEACPEIGCFICPVCSKAFSFMKKNGVWLKDPIEKE